MTPRVPRAKKAYDTLSLGSTGLEMGLAVLVGWWIGQWLDGKFGTEPYLMLVFLGCGIAAAFKGLFRAARQTKRAVAESEGVDGEDAARAGADPRPPAASPDAGERDNEQWT